MKFELKMLKFGTTYGRTLASDEVTGFAVDVIYM
jgi:hypothetical protein